MAHSPRVASDEPTIALQDRDSVRSGMRVDLDHHANSRIVARVARSVCDPFLGQILPSTSGKSYYNGLRQELCRSPSSLRYA